MDALPLPARTETRSPTAPPKRRSNRAGLPLPRPNRAGTGPEGERAEPGALPLSHRDDGLAENHGRDLTQAEHRIAMIYDAGYRNNEVSILQA